MNEDELLQELLDDLEDEGLSNIAVDHQSIWLEVWEDTGNIT